MHARAKRYPRIRRCEIKRLCHGFRVMRRQDDSRHPDALQHADRSAHIRAIRHTALVVLDRNFCNHRAAGHITQCQHSCTQRCKSLRAAQIVKCRILMQQRAEHLLAQADVIHGHRALTILLIRNGRTVERKPNRQRGKALRPDCTRCPIRRDCSGKPRRRVPVVWQVIRLIQKDLRCAA